MSKIRILYGKLEKNVKSESAICSFGGEEVNEMRDKCDIREAGPRIPAQCHCSMSPSGLSKAGTGV